MRGLSFKLTGDTAKAVESLQGVTDKLAKLTDFTHKFKLDADDKLASIKLREIGMGLDKLDKKVARPGISVEGLAKANLELDRFAFKLDRLGGKTARPGIGGMLGGLSSGLGSIPLGGTAMVGIGAFLASMLPAAVPLALGGGVAGIGALGAAHYSGKTFSGDERSISRSLGSVFKPFAADLKPMADQFAKFVHSMGPELSGALKASLPFAKSFLQFLEQSSKTLLPALSQSLTQLNKSGALKTMMQGLSTLVVGMSSFITRLGPGMGAAAQIFKMTSIGLATSMEWLGNTAVVLAKVIRWTFRAVAVTFDWIRHVWADNVHRIVSETEGLKHRVLSSFDSLRHGVASIWDSLWQNTIGRVIRGAREVASWFGKLPGMISRAISSLPGILFRAGANIIGSLISGIESRIGGILNVMGSISSKIASFIPHSPAKTGPLSGSGSPELGGRRIATMLAAGISSGTSVAATAAAGLAGSISTGYGSGVRQGAHSAAGAGIILEYHGSGGNLEKDLFDMFAKGIRVRGGDPRILVRKVVLA
jgi:hypothetical protein